MYACICVCMCVCVCVGCMCIGHMLNPHEKRVSPRGGTRKRVETRKASLRSQSFVQLADNHAVIY